MYFWVITTLSLIACIVVFLLSPVEDRNKRLDEKEHHVYHIRAIVVMTIEAVAAILLFVFHFKQFVLVLEIAWCSLAVMLLLGKGKNPRVDDFLALAGMFDLSSREVKTALGEVCTAVAQYPELARQYGVKVPAAVRFEFLR